MIRNTRSELLLSRRFTYCDVIIFVSFGFLLLCSCALRDHDSVPAANSKPQSVHTSLSPCKEAVDESDPNETPYFACPGVAGYALQVRQVGSGRSSINVVNPAKQQFPLNYEEVVTRSMSSLDNRAEWRIRTKKERLVPLALIVRVMAHENLRDPEKTTNIYLAVAKITATEVCVTDRIRQGSKSSREMQAMADSAATRDCLPHLPFGVTENR